jgi:hypothetical protein
MALLTPYVHRGQITALSATTIQFAAGSLTYRPIKLASPSGRSASLTALPAALTISGGAGTKYIFAALAAPTAEYGGSGGLIQKYILNAQPWNQPDWVAAFQTLRMDDGSYVAPGTNSAVSLVMTTTEAPPDTHHVALGTVVWSGTAITSFTSFDGEVAEVLGSVSGTIDTQVGLVSTPSSTVETTLYSLTLAANTLAVLGDEIVIYYAYRTAADGNTKTLRVKWNGATILTRAAADNTGIFKGEVRIARTGAATQFCLAHLLGTNSAGPAASALAQAGTATLSGTVVFEITGQNGTAAAIQINLDLVRVEFRAGKE